MSDQLLGALKVCLLILLYLFFARVLWAVWSEVRLAKAQSTDSRSGLATASPKRRGKPTPPAYVPPTGADGIVEGTEPTDRPVDPGRERRAVRPKRGAATRLVVLEPRSMKGVAYPIGDELTIGRGAGCTISLATDTFLSTVHARVYRVGDQATVEDLGSTNGSFLNGNRLTAPVVLSKGDRLQLGNTVMEID